MSGLPRARCELKYIRRVSSETTKKMAQEEKCSLALSMDGEDLHKFLQAHGEALQGDCIWSILIQKIPAWT